MVQWFEYHGAIVTLKQINCLANIVSASVFVYNVTSILRNVLREKKMNRKIFKAVRQGLVLAMPITMIGAFVTVFLSLPVPAYQDFIR